VEDFKTFYATNKEFFAPSFLYHLMNYMNMDVVKFPNGEQYDRSQLKGIDSWNDIQPMEGGETNDNS
jgi:hypothetical protein